MAWRSLLFILLVVDGIFLAKAQDRALTRIVCSALDDILFNQCWTNVNVPHTAARVVDCICTLEPGVDDGGVWGSVVDLNIETCIDYYSTVSPDLAPTFSIAFEGYCSSYAGVPAGTGQARGTREPIPTNTEDEAVPTQANDADETPLVTLPAACNSVISRVLDCWTDTRTPLFADEVVSCACTPDPGVAPSVYASRFNSAARRCVTYASADETLASAFDALESYCSPIVTTIDVSITWSPSAKPTAIDLIATAPTDGTAAPSVVSTTSQNGTTVGNSAGRNGFDHVSYILVPLLVMAILAL